MRPRLPLAVLVTAAALIAGAALIATAALAQHHHQHGHHHGHAATSHVDAGAQLADAVDAGAPTGAAHGRPTQSPTAGTGANCVAGTHLVSMRSPPSSAARPCVEDADCGLAQITCCAPCGEAGENDVVAVQVTAVTAWNEALCDGQTTCPRCRSQMSHTLSAVCVRRLCEVQVHQDCGGTATASAPAAPPTSHGSHWSHTSDWNDSEIETSE